MNFFNPLAFIGLISIPIIVVMYILKQKFKEKSFSDLFLWENALTIFLAQKPWQKFRNNILFFLQILLAFFLVMALSFPYIKGKTEVENFILILDSGISMNANDISPSRFEKAKSEMKKLISSSSQGSIFSIISATNSPYTVVNRGNDKNILIKEIDNLEPTNSGIDINATVSLVEIMKNEEDSEVYMFSDNDYDFGEISKKNVLVGSSIENVAISALTHSKDADRIVVMAKVKNFGDKPVETMLAIYLDDSFYDAKEIKIEGKSEENIFFTSIPLGVSEIKARLAEDDFLSLDNEAYTVVTQENVQKVLLVSEQNIFLENILSLLKNIEFYKSIGDEEELSGYYLYVFDGIVPEKLPTDGHVLLFNPPEGNSLIETKGSAKIAEIYSGESKLLNYIPNMNFAVSESKVLEKPDWADTILSSAETPLIIAGENNNKKLVVVGFDLHNTDLVLKKEFPVFIYNLIQFFIPINLYSGGDIYAGDNVEFNIYPDAEKATVTSPSGEKIILAPPFPISAFSKTNELGFYTLEQDLKEDTIYGKFVVNASTDFSDLTRDKSIYDENNGIANTSIVVNKSIGYIFLILIIVLLLTEWWVYCNDN